MLWDDFIFAESEEEVMNINWNWPQALKSWWWALAKELIRLGVRHVPGSVWIQK
jgi:hypothetical protein